MAARGRTRGGRALRPRQGRRLGRCPRAYRGAPSKRPRVNIKVQVEAGLELEEDAAWYELGPTDVPDGDRPPVGDARRRVSDAPAWVASPPRERRLPRVGLRNPPSRLRRPDPPPAPP